MNLPAVIENAVGLERVHRPFLRRQDERYSDWSVGVEEVGIAKSGIGDARKNRRHARPIQRAHRVDRSTRALSVAMPVFAYIWRYSFEMSTNATRERHDSTTRDRSHTRPQL